MKVLLFTGYGKNYVTPKMRKLMYKDGEGHAFSIKARSSRVISYIEEKATAFNSIMEDASLEVLSSGDEGIVSFKERPNQYFVKDGDDICSFSIMDVEEGKSWAICSSNGIERLEYVNAV